MSAAEPLRPFAALGTVSDELYGLESLVMALVCLSESPSDGSDLVAEMRGVHGVSQAIERMVGSLKGTIRAALPDMLPINPDTDDTFERYAAAAERMGSFSPFADYTEFVAARYGYAAAVDLIVRSFRRMPDRPPASPAA